MRKYIDAELYRNFNRAYYRNFVIAISLLAIALNVVWTLNEFTNNYATGFQAIEGFLSMGTIFVIFFVDMVTTEEYKNDTMKNVVSSGLSRDKIVLGKILATVTLAFLALVIILGLFFVSGFFILNKPPVNQLKPVAIDAGIKLLNAIPIWIAFVVVATFTALNFRSSIGAIAGYLGIINIIPNILSLISMLLQKTKMADFFDKISLYSALERVAASTVGFRRPEMVIALVYILVFTILSLITFRKKDI